MDLIGQQNMEEIKPLRHEHKQLKGTCATPFKTT
jgi:hypothetical protein